MVDDGLILLGLVSLGAWAYLLFGRAWFWRADQRLDPAPPALAEWPFVVAIVPARDEEETVAACLDSLANQDYPGCLRIVLVDDASADQTKREALESAARSPVPMDVIAASPTAKGWTGKLWALQHGVNFALKEAPEAAYLWFTDADVVHAPSVLHRLVAKAVSDRRDLVSLMVRLEVGSFWERLLIPGFVFFFQKLYPFRAVNAAESRVAGAAGGCLLIAAGTLRQAGGLEAIKEALIDDCALAKAVQKAGGRLWLGLAEDSYSLRGYATFAAIWRMVTRTAFTQLRHSPVLLAGTVVAMGLIYLAPPALALSFPLHGNVLAAGAGTGAWGAMVIAYRPTLSYYHGGLQWGLLLPVTAALYTAMTVGSAVQHWRGRGGLWKGRVLDHAK